MADMREADNAPGPLQWGRVVAAAMVAIGALLALVAAVWAVAGFFLLGELKEPPATAYMEGTSLVLTMLMAWAVALLLWGGAAIVRRMEKLHEALREGAVSGTSALPGSAGQRPGSAAAADVANLLEELVRQTRDMRDIALLSEHERTMRVRTESAALAAQLEREVPILLREHEWQEAKRRVHEARLRFPSLATWDDLAEQVEQARAQFETHEVEAATREVNDLATLGAWDRAAVVVHELQQRHPNSEPVVTLVHRVQAGLNKAGAEERARLMSKAQEATNLRDWIEALRWVEQVVEKFPRSAEAHDLRQQLPTLRTNAEIQTRQRLEHEIREHIKEGRVAEALRRARELIALYPDSPQAAALREQIPRLEQRARHGG